jgi:hypothetical protein
MPAWDAISAALPAGASVIIVLLLRVLHVYNPPPPGTWTEYLTIPVIYLSSIAGAEAASFWKPRTHARQLFLFVSAAILFICSAFGYAYLSDTPPTASELVLFIWGASAAFILSQALFGFCAWKIVVFLMGQSGAKRGTRR